MPGKPGRLLASLVFGVVLAVHAGTGTEANAGAPMGAPARTAPVVMKLATAGIGDSRHEWMKRFVALVEEKSGGRIKGEIYPASRLGSNQRMIEGTRFGSIQAYLGPVDAMSGTDPRFRMLGAPGLFDSLAHAARALRDPAVKEAFSELGSDRGLKLAGAFPTGAYVFATTAPVKRVEDLAGKRIRIPPSPMQAAEIRALGATPVPMPPGEVLPALRRGALDGAMSTMETFVPQHYSDTAGYLVDTGHSVLVAGVVLGRTWFDGLPADLQEAVMDAADETTKSIAERVADIDEQRHKAWVAAGGALVTPSKVERAALFETMRPIGEEVASGRPGDERFFELLRKAAGTTR